MKLVIANPLERIIAEGIARGESFTAVRPEYQPQLVELWKTIVELL